jgi:hypothetical protein
VPQPVHDVVEPVEDADEPHADDGRRDAPDGVYPVFPQRDEVEGGQVQEGLGAEGGPTDDVQRHRRQHNDPERFDGEVAEDELERPRKCGSASR